MKKLNTFIASFVLPVTLLTYTLITRAREKKDSVKKIKVNPCKVPLEFGKGAATSDSNAAS